tara:strand:- start:7240 stop:8082 length:843 start_codon:yes stop_codon:yes gene_type:complete
MDFKIGYNVKPKEINSVNEVIFEEYSVEGIYIDVTPTADECKGYGFTFAASKCWVLASSTDFISQNSILEAGKMNVIGSKSDDSLIVGVNNLLKYSNNNDLIVGDNNRILDNVDNSIISGTSGEATASNSIVLGGNNSTDALGFKQTINLMYGGQTVTSGWISSYLNNTTASFLNVPDNTAMYFHCDVLAVRVGGTAAGSIGDFASWVERGVIINKSGVTSIQRERDAIKSSGTVTGWMPSAAVSATNTNFLLNIKGAADVTIEWASNIKFTQIKTGVAL